MRSSLLDGIHEFDSSSTSLKLWNNFVRTEASAGFNHQFEWKLINELEFGHDTHYIASVSEGKIVGILPLILIRSRLFGKILCSLPFVNYCGPATRNPDVERQMLAYAYEIAEREKTDYFEIRALRICDNELPRSHDKVSMTVRLADDPDIIWGAFKSKHRNNIRRVYKAGLRVESGHIELLDAFYELLSRSWRDLGTPIYSKQFFASVLDSFGSKVKIFIAYQGDTPVAGAFNGYCGNTVEGMWAGSAAEHRRLQSNYVLYWEMIKAACEEGFENFHLGRTSVDSGGEAFKRKWNAEVKQLYWQYFLPQGGDLSHLDVKNPKYKLAIETWKKLPVRLTQLVGPLVARSIP